MTIMNLQTYRTCKTRCWEKVANIVLGSESKQTDVSITDKISKRQCQAPTNLIQGK